MHILQGDYRELFRTHQKNIPEKKTKPERKRIFKMKQQVQLMGLHKEFQAVFYLKQCLLLQLCLGLNLFF